MKHQQTHSKEQFLRGMRSGIPVILGFVPVGMHAQGAGILAWKKYPVMGCVLAAIAADFILYLFV